VLVIPSRLAPLYRVERRESTLEGSKEGVLALCALLLLALGVLEDLDTLHTLVHYQNRCLRRNN
jgi:hypothetical protein